MSDCDDRIICPHCGRRITPRLSFQYGEPYRSYCPYCKGRTDQIDEPVSGLAFVLLIILAIIFFWD